MIGNYRPINLETWWFSSDHLVLWWFSYWLMMVFDLGLPYGTGHSLLAFLVQYFHFEGTEQESAFVSGPSRCILIIQLHSFGGQLEQRGKKVSGRLTRGSWKKSPMSKTNTTYAMVFHNLLQFFFHSTKNFRTDIWNFIDNYHGHGFRIVLLFFYFSSLGFATYSISRRNRGLSFCRLLYSLLCLCVISSPSSGHSVILCFQHGGGLNVDGYTMDRKDQEIGNFMAAYCITNVDRQKAMLLHFAGDDVFEITSTLDLCPRQADAATNQPA